MPSLLNTSSVMMCPHGGQVQPVSSNSRAQAGGAFLLRASDTFTIAGCSFNLGVTLHPCVQVQWVQPAGRSKAVSDFTLTQASVGLCLAADMAPQGSVIVSMTQARVSGV
ncbi:hypothetical protein XI09_05235 [Bradyrhizobium sp. CCBAU 11386]|uniref:hypothetical protein n=1 Tax=Bradyrhizobium sp. CCBAU 11386 TaxID=1630837 RepID=UPI002304C35F|nr:hypothetical protein [Bradyrhizobium sp. CCBAU 11386]MDA9504175.1 hypothetical protein [Bradyrhizobium sp. CCBAU 11386]